MDVIIELSSERIPWVELGIGVKHVHSSSWAQNDIPRVELGMVDEHEEPLSWAWVGECCRCECAGCGQYEWVQLDCPPQLLADEFGSLRTLWTMSVIGNSTWRYSVWSVALVPGRALSVVADRFGSKLPWGITRRGRTRMVLLWPDVRELIKR